MWFYITTDESGLPSNDVYGFSITETDAWFATDLGLAYNRGSEWKVYDAAHGFPSDVVFGVTVVGGDVWAATAAGAVRIRDGRLKVFTTADGLPSDRLVALAYDGAHVWFASEAGLVRFDDPGFTVITGVQGLPGDDVRDVYAVGVNEIWAACLGGAAFFDHGNIKSYTVADGGLPSNYVYAAAARGADAWLGTDEGLCHLRNGAVVKTYTSGNSGLKNNVINDLGYRANGELWVGTAGGGAARRVGDDFETFDRNRGLLSDYVLAVCGDKLGYVWLGTLGGGVNRFDG